MNLGGLVGALLPVFFVLALGYVAGKRHSFNSDQAAGLSELALGFALPASLFVGMTEIPKDLLLQQGRLVLALILSHDGLFLVAWLLLRKVKSLQGSASIICALLLATSATSPYCSPCSATPAQVRWDSLRWPLTSSSQRPLFFSKRQAQGQVQPLRRRPPVESRSWPDSSPD
jgi:predicted permease